METALIILLAAMVALLAILLVVRIRRERLQNSVLRQLRLSEYAEFIKSSIQENSIQTVASGVSQMLREACACEKIIFLRKRRQLLELNYFFGINRFNRRDLRARYADDLVARLKGNLLPQPVAEIAGLLPASLTASLARWECDLYFPIFWRDHLYGLYFIKSNSETRSHAFKVVVASLAQALSAAYHVKWQEERLVRLQEKVDQLESLPRSGRAGMHSLPSGVMKLIRHHDSETIVARIVDEVGKDLDLSRFAFLYEPKAPDEPLLLLKRGIEKDLAVPERRAFGDMLQKLGGDGPREVAQLGGDQGELSVWGEELRRVGLRFVTTLQLSGDRTGVLAWDDKQAADRVMTGLERHRDCVVELVENAASFERVEELSYTDSLTGLYNQRYFFKRLGEEIHRAERYQRHLGLIIFDLDDLKSVNDSYGHQAGDRVLQQMGELLRNSVRAIDVIARYGGDEFCIVMPESDANTCLQFMRRLQRKISGHKFRIPQFDKELDCTVSMGGALYPDHGGSPEQLIYSADMALLKAKEAGRDRCVIY